MSLALLSAEKLTAGAVILKIVFNWDSESIRLRNTGLCLSIKVDSIVGSILQSLVNFWSWNLGLLCNQLRACNINSFRVNFFMVIIMFMIDYNRVLLHCKLLLDYQVLFNIFVKFIFVITINSLTSLYKSSLLWLFSF